MRSDTCQVQVQLQSFFAQPTVADLVATILALMTEQIDKAWLTELEQLSPDDVQMTLDSE